MEYEIQKLNSKDFPALLKEIPDPPETLYIRGSLPPTTYKLLTVVGSRRMSRYGEDACRQLIRGLAGYPVAVVSGLALGIDGVAHRAALDAGIPTIAIPGSGLSESVLYPRAHVRLARDIVSKGGALLSEMEPDEAAAPYTFPKRNRLMAGIAHAILVIEAGVKSGTLITAKLAVDYNRELLVVPHSIFDEGGAGGHVFTKLGALSVRTAHDILDALGIHNEQKQERMALAPNEEKIMQMLVAPMTRDELIRALRMPIASANVLLASMELRGLIVETMGEIRKAI